MTVSKSLYGDNYFSACLVMVNMGKAARGEHPSGECVVSAVNSLSVAQCYILTIRLWPLSSTGLSVSEHWKTLQRA